MAVDSGMLARWEAREIAKDAPQAPVKRAATRL
jgi:hypothetical protein